MMPIQQTQVHNEPASNATNEHMVWIDGGTFHMGSDRHYPEEGPSHEVNVEGQEIRPSKTG
jgi:formylglycine-generating enzyme required for sulfatase activity